MRTKTESTLATLTVGLLVLVWFGVFLLVWYVPRLSAMWAETGAELSASQRLLVTLGGVVSRGFLAIGPLLLAATGAAVLWRFAAVRKCRRNPA